jgi:hypothetical protein
MSTARLTSLVIGLSVFLGASCSAMAQLGPLDKMVMPGQLSKAHAKFENQCSNCHMPFKKSAQADLCLDCHDHAAVAEDVATGRGYHGRLKEKQCSACHVEHKGRGMNIAPLDKKLFNHNLTDYPLEGAHVDPKITCEDCHKPGLKYRDAPSDCYSCHKKDDVHEGKLGKNCVHCHVDRSWKEIRFDHSQTDFPLDGRHLFVKCDACHANERYKNTPKDCYSCHRSDDNKKGHKGRFGKKCETCHIPKSWTVSIFDHKCVDCHKGYLYQEKLQTGCYSCHKRDDEQKGHKGRFGTKCETCHTPRDWKRVIFDHDRDTKYPLRGKHREVKCASCHKGILYKENLNTTCFSCHEKDDAHKGQEGKRCEQCHDERSWKKAFFDHGLTRFPLLGKHAKVACEDCHKETTFKDASIECASCHEKDDVHKRRLGPLCEQCHNTRDWREWDFDHNKRTQFPLDGAHERLHCHACHTIPVRKKISLAITCVSCHSADDVHRGAFGRTCERCHVTSSFGDLKAVGRR